MYRLCLFLCYNIFVDPAYQELSLPTKEEIYESKEKNRALKIVIPVAIIALFGSLCSYWAIHLNTDDYLDKMLALMSLVVSALSAYFIVIQLKGEKAISEADFLVNLNQTFTGDAGYARVYTELEKELSDPPQKPQLSRIEISNYLTFFETIYLLIEEGVLDISAIGFQKKLMKMLEKKAVEKGYTHSCTSIHPDNIYSMRNAVSLGYKYDHTARKYGGMVRDILVKTL